LVQLLTLRQSDAPQEDQVFHAHTSDALAEFERGLIRTRTGEERERAKAGVETTRMMWWTTPAPGIECAKG
jgi:hypothetical protein